MNTGHNDAVATQIASNLENSVVISNFENERPAPGNDNRQLGLTQTEGNEISKINSDFDPTKTPTPILKIDAHWQDSSSFFTPENIAKLPNPEDLQKYGINRIVILTESKIGEVNVNDLNPLLKGWVEKLRDAAVKVEIRGIDPRIN